MVTAHRTIRNQTSDDDDENEPSNSDDQQVVEEQEAEESQHEDSEAGSEGDDEDDDSADADVEDLEGWSDVEEVDEVDQRPVPQKFQDNWKSEMSAACHYVSSLPSPDDPEAVAEDWFEKLCLAAKEAAKKSLPTRQKSALTQRMVSQRTNNLIRQKKLCRKDKKALKEIKARIQESSLLDFKTWVSDTVSDIEKANELGDVRKIFNLVNMLSNKPSQPPSNITKDEHGNILKSPEETENFP